MTTKERAIERAQVEEVFGLTGGELEDSPWEVMAAARDEDERFALAVANCELYSPRNESRTFHYWYEGAPDYFKPELKDRFNEGVEYRTVIHQELYGELPARFQDRDSVWVQIRSFRSSGEVKCPFAEENDEHSSLLDEDGRCELCGEVEHGFIYLGDGWCELVYRCQS